MKIQPVWHHDISRRKTTRRPACFFLRSLFPSSIAHAGKQSAQRAPATTRSRSRGARGIDAALLLVLLACAGSTAGCGFSQTAVEEFPRKTITIVDDDGKAWDVTSAVYDHGMQLDRFHHGIGKDAIPPLLAPTLISVDDDGFPAPTESFPVLGTHVGSDVRAYGIWDIVWFEVVDEVIGDTPVAVAY